MGQLVKKWGVVYRRNLFRKGSTRIDCYRLKRCGRGSVLVTLARSRGTSAYRCRAALWN